MRIAGVVLAGGQSRRFGSDKAEENFGGRSLLDWSLAALAPHVELLLVSGRPHPRHLTVADRPAAGLGPLGGLAGALAAAQDRQFTHLLSLPCDTPRLPHGLLDALQTHPEGCFAASCPVIGFWPTRLGAELETHLAAGGPRSMRAWTQAAGIMPLDWTGDIPNINSPVDLADLGGANV